MARRYPHLRFDSGVDYKDVNAALLANLNRMAMNVNQVFTVTSGYRTYAHQAELYRIYVASGYNISHIAARPGHSAHESGLALDVTVNGTPIGNMYTKAQLNKFGLVAPVPGDPVHVQFAGTTNTDVYPSWWKGGKGKAPASMTATGDTAAPVANVTPSSSPAQAPPAATVTTQPDLTIPQYTPPGGPPDPASALPGLSMPPGSVQAGGFNTAQAWQMIASQQLASPESQQIAARVTGGQ